MVDSYCQNTQKKYAKMHLSLFWVVCTQLAGGLGVPVGILSTDSRKFLRIKIAGLILISCIELNFDKNSIEFSVPIPKVGAEKAPLLIFLFRKRAIRFCFEVSVFRCSFSKEKKELLNHSCYCV